MAKVVMVVSGSGLRLCSMHTRGLLPQSTLPGRLNSTILCIAAMNSNSIFSYSTDFFDSKHHVAVGFVSTFNFYFRISSDLFVGGF
jgi:hypothetical protein